MLKSASLAALLVLMAVPPVVHAQANSLFIEDLTWEEVAAALKAGKTTALIYTGGAEQNGPHLAFGKHNAVARNVSERIAKELGNALAKRQGGAGQGAAGSEGQGCRGPDPGASRQP